MMPRKTVLLALIIALAMGVWTCGGGDSEPTQTASPMLSAQPTSTETQQPAATASTAEEKAIKSAEEFFANPPDFAVDLTDDILADPVVPSADMDIPQTDVGNLDMNLGDMLIFDVDIPAFTLPKTTGLVDMPSISTSSMMPSIPTSTTGGTSTPTTTTAPSVDCSMFSTMPDASYCSMLPASLRQQCEQCKANAH